MKATIPALARYTQQGLLGKVWKRPGLSPRDPGIATVATLVARGQTANLPFYVDLALDNGVTPAEISEILTHLAFYAGWPNAFSAMTVAKGVFDARAK